MANLPLTTIAARTRAAQCILDTQDLLALYENVGGLKEDLEHIRDEGLNAEAQLLAQSTAKGAQMAATAGALLHFSALQKEYVAVMSALRAVALDLKLAKSAPELLKAVEQILVNETAVTVQSVQSEGQEKTTKTKKSHSTSLEALRAEIAKDAQALIALGAAHAALQKRKVDKTRLETLAADAQALKGKLAEKAIKKGEKSSATAAKHEAAFRQAERWGACYRLLALVGRKDPRVAALLAEAVRSKSEKKAAAGG